ncbi:hypothetical protein CCUS01_13842 [Colletotrichum cuscutae]|uniref:COX assembly mitochondrial protein n=1 Tax=Colletotrichum cuscutae TaxID=1209917 RepID=A0AAI9YAI6_9PEZI|nr:hypothetical protein CCUS01_13842 [Colletotrichum cuscutae]
MISIRAPPPPSRLWVIQTPSHCHMLPPLPPGYQCEDIMVALEECHAKGFMFKSLGGCNDAKDKVSECLRGARARRTEANRAAARAKREERENRIKELNKSLGLD